MLAEVVREYQRITLTRTLCVTGLMVCSKDCAKHVIGIILFKPHGGFFTMRLVFLSILQVRKQRFSEVFKQLAHRSLRIPIQLSLIYNPEVYGLFCVAPSIHLFL